jgi:tetratricopeptide (TPR) repeat protein
MTIKTERLLSRAKKLFTKGNFAEAESIYLEVLKLAPNNKDAKNAISALKNKKNIVPIPQSELQSAVSFVTNGNISEALKIVEPLIKNYPNESILYNIRGVCSKAKNEFKDAVNDFNQAVLIKPDYAEAYYNLGVTLREMGDSQNAIKAYQEALKHNNHYPKAHNNLGQVFLVMGNLDSAIDHLEWAVALQPEFADAHNNLGSAYLGNNRVSDAIESYKKAVTLNPNFSISFNNLGIGYQRLGEEILAAKNFENAIALSPNYATAHHNLSGVKSYKSGDLQFDQIESLLSQKDISQPDRIMLNFALAKAHEDMGNKKEFFKALNEANSLRKETSNYSIDKSENHNQIVKKFFKKSPSKKEKKTSFKPTEIRPIFIVGMPRSGTSLIEQIISSHEEVYGAGELRNLTNLITPLLQKHIANEKFSLSISEFSSIREDYLRSLAKLNVSEKVITDKWPLNFRNIGFILSAFPEAKIIHVRRDARAICWSIYRNFFSGQGNGWAYSFDDLAKFYVLYEELMSYWHQIYPNRIYDISYEELTINQEKETRDLLDYCNLDWDQNCLKFHENKRDVNTASALQVRKKMYQGSSDAWKKYEKFLEPLVKSLKDY